MQIVYMAGAFGKQYRPSSTLEPHRTGKGLTQMHNKTDAKSSASNEELSSVRQS